MEICGPDKSLLQRRILIADMGCAIDPHNGSDFKPLSFEAIAQMAAEQHVGLILLTGLPTGGSHQENMAWHLPQYVYVEAHTEGSDILAAWRKDIWFCPDIDEIVLTEETNNTPPRVGVLFTLQPVSYTHLTLPTNREV